MKLKLRAENEIQILTIAELDSSQNVDVLRAGITQIFKNGKNRIILELVEPKNISAELLRELGRLKLLANELAGDIVLSGLDPETKQKIDNFSKPPFAISFLTTPQAVNYLKELSKPQKGKAATLAPAPAPIPTPSLAATAVPQPQAAPAPAAGATAGPVPGMTEQFKEELRKRELGEVGQLRKEIERLKTENQSLMDILHKKVLERREPPNMAAYETRIRDLEKQLTDILSQPPAPKK
jgi:hypothetical protein